MTKARRLGVLTPVLYAVDPVIHTLTFEYVEGPSVKDVFLGIGSTGVFQERLTDIATQIGDAIGKLHDGGLVHGDLTTSNMLIRNGTNKLVLIDFGLSFTSTLPEDKAVDLYVLERALISMHSSCGNVMDLILAAYKKSSKQWSSTLNKLAQGTAFSVVLSLALKFTASYVCTTLISFIVFLLVGDELQCDKGAASEQWLDEPPFEKSVKDFDLMQWKKVVKNLGRVVRLKSEIVKRGSSWFSFNLAAIGIYVCVSANNSENVLGRKLFWT
ncbi:hypothetical protein Godav_005480, partial [Gossypium davidsonii]|nr:hypothetical protein [Gossypium davidsonii]MBA0655023.1 hypothetical protein [Gossypium klotzschianum]